MVLKVKKNPDYGLSKNVTELGYSRHCLAARGRHSHVCEICKPEKCTNFVLIQTNLLYLFLMFLVEILVLKYTFEIHYNLTLVLHWFKQAFETIFSMNHVCTKTWLDLPSVELLRSFLV